MTELVAAGRLRSAGVSNFEPAHLDRVVTETGIVPVVNQIEAHPYFANNGVRQASLAHGVVVEAWGPLGQGAVLDDAVLTEVGGQVGRTASQVALRWHVQRGDIIFPKSMRRERMEQNLAIFDFELTDAQMAAIDGLDKGEAGRGGPHPDTFDLV
jgi:2,5-diketo-D-gluconate reductase A